MKLLALSILLLCACSDDPALRSDASDAAGDGDAVEGDVADVPQEVEVIETLVLGEPGARLGG